ncbi:MAG: chemotaxis protein CheW [Coriobacteriia bacterium]|nr:chemotaxis protein CheW [Coriobacteriia bacterium]
MEGTSSDAVRQVVLFTLGEEEFGLPVERVTSIIRYEKPTPVPHAPDFVEGVINLRGQIVPVVDLGRRLFGEGSSRSGSSRVIVTETTAGLVGFAVDSAHEVARMSAAAVMQTPESLASSELADAFEGVADHEGRLVMLLVPDKLVPPAVFVSVTDAEEASADV